MKKILQDELNKSQLDINKICKIIVDGERFLFFPAKTIGVFDPVNEHRENLFHVVLNKASDDNFIELYSQIQNLLKNIEFRNRENVKEPNENFVKKLSNVKTLGQNISPLDIALKKGFIKSASKLLEAGARISSLNADELYDICFNAFSKNLKFLELLLTKLNLTDNLSKDFFDKVIFNLVNEHSKNASFFKILFTYCWADKNFLGQEKIAKVFSSDKISEIMQKINEIHRSDEEVSAKSEIVKAKLEIKAEEILNELIKQPTVVSSNEEVSIVEQVYSDHLSAKDNTIVISTSSDEKSYASMNVINFAQILRDKLSENKSALEDVEGQLGDNITTLQFLIFMRGRAKEYFRKKFESLNFHKDRTEEKIFYHEEGENVEVFFENYIKLLNKKEFREITKNNKLNVFSLAAIYDQHEIIKILVEAGCYDRSNISLVNAPIKSGSFATLKYLTTEGLIVKDEKDLWSHVLFTSIKYANPHVLKIFGDKFDEKILNTCNGDGTKILDYTFKKAGDFISLAIEIIRKPSMIEEKELELKDYLKALKNIKPFINFLFSKDLIKYIELSDFLNITKILQRFDAKINKIHDHIIKLEKDQHFSKKFITIIKEYFEQGGNIFNSIIEQFPDERKAELKSLKAEWDNLSMASTANKAYSAISVQPKDYELDDTAYQNFEDYTFENDLDLMGDKEI
jgi:hypothetical protein